jgi:hypothetical protein
LEAGWAKLLHEQNTEQRTGGIAQVVEHLLSMLEAWFQSSKLPRITIYIYIFYVYTYICVYTYFYVYIYMHFYIYLCVYICIFTHKKQNFKNCGNSASTDDSYL